MTGVRRLVYTPGEPAGIGPDLILMLAQNGFEHQLIAVACPQLLAERAEKLGLAIELIEFSPEQPPKAAEAGQLFYISAKLAQPVIAGELNRANAPYVLETLNTAIDGCQAGLFDAYITGPSHKGIINDAGIPFSGHTEYLADRTRTEHVVMMLATEGLRVALATTHLPLRYVADQITEPLLQRVLSILHQDLQLKFGIKDPTILVCGLNPHAGEGGHLGREEIDVIEPLMAKLSEQGMKLIGPLPADTLFTPKILESADAVLAMYHDQGLPVLKYKGFGNAVNITLGLPITRTSVDHGTALDLAGSGQCDTGSLKVAIEYAEQMAAAKQRGVKSSHRSKNHTASSLAEYKN